MKKFFIITAAVIVIAFGFSYFAPLPWKKNHPAPAAGGTPEDFILGMSNSVTYRLNDFLGRNVIILVFLDNSVNSRKFEEACAGSLNESFGNRRDLIWFNIKRGVSHTVIQEQTKKLSLTYRTPAFGIPAFYSFSNLPSVLVIDKNGIIKLLYSGYSPTIFSDIKNSLPKAAK
jgi:hypothetical protein